ncbi:MAG: TonB-dependent heme/hemoglobin receptor family protein, partial [Mesorhizobium sp.]
MKLTSNKTLMASTAVAFALGLCAVPLAAAQEPEKKGAAAKTDRAVKPPQQARTGQNEPTVLDLITISATMIKTAIIESMAAISAIDQKELDRIQT